MTRQDERTLLAGLRALREQTEGESAPERVEAAVLAEFRARPLTARFRFTRWWLFAAAAAACVIVAIAVYSVRIGQHAPVARVDPGPKAPAAEQPKSVETVSSAAASEPTARVVSRRRVRPARSHPANRGTVESPAEETTDFLPVVAAPPLVEGERAAVVRVDLPRSSLRTFGLPYAEERHFERVKADVVVGQDGLIRAVRFVR